MIPESGHITACFTTLKEGHRLHEYLRVVAWDDDGNALVPDADSGRLVVARNQPGFNGLEGVETDSKTPVALIPGGGWIADHGDGYTAPVVAWGVSGDGEMRAYTRCDESWAEPSGGRSGLRFHVRHPDETEG